MIKAAKIPEWKTKEIEAIKDLVNQYSVLGVVDLTNLPTPQLYYIKTKLKGIILLKLAKKRLVKIAFDQLKDKKNIVELKENLIGIPALIFTNETPFRLYRHLSQAKTLASAKPGQIAPKDIIIPPGPTPFTPGPIISELGRFGIKTAVEEGKIVIKNEVVAANEGETIKRDMADLLLKLGIKPMEVGLNLVSVYDNGFIYKKDVLSFDEDAYKTELRKAYNESLALAMEIGYITEDTIVLLIKEAYLGAKGLSEKIPSKEEVEEAPKKEEPAKKEIEKPKEEIPKEEPKEVPSEKEELLRKAKEKKIEPKEVTSEKKIEAEPKKEKKKPKEVKKEPKKSYFKKEKKPSAKELLEEIEEDEKSDRYYQFKKTEKIARKILEGG